MSASSTLKVTLLSENATVPTKGSPTSAGYDLYAVTEGTVPAYGHDIFKIGISVELPKGTYGRIAPRSSLSAKFGIETGAGVVDEDYRGEIGVILFNHSKNRWHFKKGDRIAQFIVTEIRDTVLEVVDKLSETDRGEGGFGSTGK